MRVPKSCAIEFLSVSIAVFLSCSVHVHANTRSADADQVAAERCTAIRSADLSMLQDAPTQIIETKLVTRSDAAPGYCEVSGYVSPSFGFLLRLPLESWNGKFLEHGCAGSCGDTNFFIRGCDDALRRGYACIVPDGGHK